MGLRCFLFSSDEEAAATIRQILAGLEVEVESCPEAIHAVEKIANPVYQVVIIDWDQQPEAGLLLSTARERKAADRPITLALVSDDINVPKALQAGANSILRKPIALSQAKDVLKTARDLFRAKRDPAAPPVSSGIPLRSMAAAPAPALIPKRMEAEKTLRAGEFLQSGPAKPGASFETESDVPGFMDQSVPQPVSPLAELEPVAASVAEEKPAPVASSEPGEKRGLEWYLNARGINRQAAPVAPLPAAVPGKPELVSFDQISTCSGTSADTQSLSVPAIKKEASTQEQKSEAELFAYMEGNSVDAENAPRPGFRLGKGTIVFALLLAGCGVAAAPQAPWHSRVQALWHNGQRSLHAWLNPQPVTLAQAPVSHESFARAGDEYKLPATENIPDATTDPSQIRVLPVVDPTAKKPNNDPANSDPATAPDAVASPATDQPQAPPIQVQENLAAQAPSTPQGSSAPPAIQPAATNPGAVPQTTATSATPIPVSPPPAPAHVEPAPAVTSPPAAKPQTPRDIFVPGNIPTSLKSQMANSTPDASGNKPLEAAMPSIEPVTVPEAAERALLSEQPDISYPSNAKGQQGTVLLQVLIGRDGTVQDAKFLQGSLAFARVAIDGVRQWKFKPYTMNGRAVSVQTTLTMSFKPSA